jgi:hypothetical protein
LEKSGNIKFREKTSLILKPNLNRSEDLHHKVPFILKKYRLTVSSMKILDYPVYGIGCIGIDNKPKILSKREALKNVMFCSRPFPYHIKVISFLISVAYNKMESFSFNDIGYIDGVVEKTQTLP